MKTNSDRLNPVIKPKADLLFEAESEKIIAASMEVLNSLGNGFHEKPYENALVVEFRLQGIQYLQQKSFKIVYKDIQVGDYFPDLIVFDKIIVDTKVIDRITDRELGQMMNYLKITGLRLGLILNFKYSKLYWKRVIL